MTDLYALLSRLERASPHVGVARHARAYRDPSATADMRWAANQEINAVYPGQGIAGYESDRREFRRIFERTVHEFASLQLRRMEQVYNYVHDSYLDGPSANARLDSLARALRSWLPFVSYAPFVYLDETDTQYWNSNVPSGPVSPDVPVDDVPRTIDDLNLSGSQLFGLGRAGMLPQYLEAIQEQRRNRRERLINLEAWTNWRSPQKSLATNEPREMAIIALQQPNHRALREQLYREHPVLLLLPHMRHMSPSQLLQIIQLPEEARRRSLTVIVRSATDRLAPAIRRFRAETQPDDPDDVEWERFRPLLEASKYLLCGAIPPRRNVHSIADDFISDMEGWSLQSVITTAAVLASLVLVAASGGTALPAAAAFWGGVGLDVTAVSVNTYLNHLENERRRSLNQFASVDAALQVASPEINLGTEALLTALGYLVPVGAGHLARRAVRASILRRVLGRSRRAAGHVPSMRQGAGDAAAATSRPHAPQTPPSTDTASRTAGDASRRATNPGARATMPPAQAANAVAERELAQLDDEIDRVFRETFDENIHGPHLPLPSGPQLTLQLSQRQRRNLGAFLDRVFTQQTGNAAVDEVKARIRAHWDAALPRRGTQSLADAALAVLNRLVQRTPQSQRGTLNQWVRRVFFGLWRRRFITRVARDRQLIQQMEQELGIVFRRRPGRGGNAFSVRATDQNGRTISVGLDIDHARIRHEESVLEALRTQSSQPLEATVRSDNLQFMSARENQNVIEILRRLDREMWSAPPPAPHGQSSPLGQ